MSYAQVESTMQTILQTVTGLSSTVTLGDDSVLDRGITSAAIIEPGAVVGSSISGRLYTTTYDCRVSLFSRYTTKAAVHSAFVTLRDAVIDKLQEYYPDIANTKNNPYGLWVEGIAADGTPQDIAMQGNPNTGPVFRAQTIVVSVRQRDTI